MMIFSQVTQKRKHMKYCLWGTRESPQEFLPVDRMSTQIRYRLSFSLENEAGRAFRATDDRVHVDITIPDTQERVLCFAIYTRRSQLIGKGEREKEREKECVRKKYMPLHETSVDRILYVKLGPTLSCISSKHRVPRGRASDRRQKTCSSHLWWPLNPVAERLSYEDDNIATSGGVCVCVPFNRACHSLHPLCLKQKEDVLAVFVKMRSRGRIIEKEKENKRRVKRDRPESLFTLFRIGNVSKESEKRKRER